MLAVDSFLVRGSSHPPLRHTVTLTELNFKPHPHPPHHHSTNSICTVPLVTFPLLTCGTKRTFENECHNVVTTKSHNIILYMPMNRTDSGITASQSFH